MSRYEVTSEAEHFPIRKDPLIFFPLSQNDESCHLCKDSETTLWRDPRGVTVSSQQPWGEVFSGRFSREPRAARLIAASVVCASDVSHLGTGRCWGHCPSRGRLTPRDGKCLGLFQLLWHNVTDRAAYEPQKSIPHRSRGWNPGMQGWYILKQSMSFHSTNKPKKKNHIIISIEAEKK